MKIIRAEHLGMCFGVRDAIAMALKQSEIGPVTVLGELVHNDAVLAELRRRGIQTERDVTKVASQTVMVTAHGTSVKRLNEMHARGLNVVSAACPLVEVAHRALQELVRDGFHPVVIGKRDHIEVRGLTEDFENFDVVSDEADVQRLQPRPRFGVVAQTTQPIERVQRLQALISKTFPHSEVRFTDTVCRPTKERQRAAIEVAGSCDVVIVIGGARSNNTRELVQTCSRHCRRVHHIQTAADLQKDWFTASDTVGVTAGTSTPDILIDQVEKTLHEWAVAS